MEELSPEEETRVLAKPRRGYDLVAESLRESGITHLYGVAGRPSEEILPACASHGIRLIGVYHQTSAVFMALAHNYQVGKLAAAVLVSAGPAATNAVTGLLVARDNGWPVIVLGGRRSSFQKCDVLPIVHSVTKHSVNVPSIAAIREHIHEACRIAMSGRPGPVYVDLHEDILAGDAAAGPDDSAARLPLRAPSVSDADLEKVAAALLSAQRPALLLGKGVRWTVVPEQLRELIDTLGLSFITSPMGRGFIPEDHPLCFNRARTVLQSQADVVLVLGARLNWMFRHGCELANAQVFRVDILRDDEDGALIPTQLVHADAGNFVTRLLDLLKSRSQEVSSSDRRQRLDDWHNALRATSEETERLLDQQINCDSRPMTPFRMMKEIRDALPRNAICITEGNVSMMAAQPVIPAFLPASRMDAGTNGCMGVGIPFAVGAKIACPDRPVVVIIGDYGFSLCAMEMEVCVRHNIPIVVVVANNQGNNGAIKQKAYFPDCAERITMFQPGLEYDRIMKIFGGQGMTITEPEMIKPALENAIAAQEPFCINIVIDPETPIPNAWGKQSSNLDISPSPSR
jgi:2-hydroxyacyl-CoA lyase